MAGGLLRKWLLKMNRIRCWISEHLKQTSVDFTSVTPAIQVVPHRWQADKYSVTSVISTTFFFLWSHPFDLRWLIIDVTLLSKERIRAMLRH